MTMLPAEFNDLEPFASRWCLASEPERLAERMRSPMPEMREFYDVVTPRAEDAMAYLEQFPLDGLTEEQTNLLHLLYSMIQVSFPIECWGQPNVPDTGSATFDLVVEPVP
jgi:hypothetical protein